MSNQRTDEEKVDALIDFLGDSIFEASSEETREECRMSGVDPDNEAARLKRMMLDTVKSFRQRALAAAREGYERHLELREKKSFGVPDSPAEQRKMLAHLIHQPQVQPFLTAHFRDLGQLTDEDIRTLLQDLAALGILADLSHGESDEE